MLIVGQDPYPTPGHPIGLSFAVEQHVRPLPRSLVEHLPGARAPISASRRAPHGDLSAWSDQGVMLLNRVLTVAPGAPGIPPRLGLGEGHRARDPHARRARRPLVAILWGRDAANLRAAARIDADHRVAASVAAVGEPRVLRLPAVLAGERAARAAGRGGRRLARSGLSVGWSECSRRNTTRTAAGCRGTSASRSEPEPPFSFEIRAGRRTATSPTSARSTTTTSPTRSSPSTRRSGRSRSGARSSTHLRKLELPFLVAESPSGQVLGYALVSAVVEQVRVPVHGRELDLPRVRPRPARGSGARCWRR